MITTKMSEYQLKLNIHRELQYLFGFKNNII